MARAWVVIYAVFAGLALFRLTEDNERVAPILIALGFVAFAIGQYLRIRPVPLNGQLYSRWSESLPKVGFVLILSGFAVRYLT